MVLSFDKAVIKAYHNMGGGGEVMMLEQLEKKYIQSWVELY